MTFKSSDGLLSSSDPRAVETWERIGRSMADAQREANRVLRERGVKMAHPDDGWVHEPGRGYTPDNPEKWLSPSYPDFDDRPRAGDLIALGQPWDGYRLVCVTEVRPRRVIIGPPGFDYHYDDTGERLAF